MNNSTPDIPTKQCTKCGETYPASTEFWYSHKRGKDGLTADCKYCVRERQRKYAEANREKESERARQWYKDNRDRGRKQRRQWYEANREKAHKQQRSWLKANRGRVRKRQRKWYETNRDKAQEIQRRWRINNPEKHRAKQRARRARKRNAEGEHTAEEVQQQYKRQKGKCYWCGEKLDKNDYHADHVIPLSKGGSNYISNIVCACPSCNLSKGGKLPHEWGAGGKLL